MNNTNLHLEHLRAFYHTVRMGSMKNASLHMGLSLSAVSSYVIFLEKQTKQHLMIRNKGGIRLTPEGVKLFQAVKESISSLEEVGKNFMFTDESISNSTIILNTWSGLAAYITARELFPFFQKHENVKLNIKCYSIDVPYDEWIGDIAVSPFLNSRNDLFQKKIFRLEYGIYASHAYIEKHGFPKNPIDLDNHYLVATTSNDSFLSDKTDWHLTIDSKERRKPLLTVDSSIAVFNAIKAGCGIGVIPTFFIETYSSDLIPLLQDIEKPYLDFYFVAPLNNKNMNLYNELLEHLSNF